MCGSIELVGVNTSKVQEPERWAEVMGQLWLKFRPSIMAMCGVHSTHAFARMSLESGQTVVDVGCGTGETTLEMARRLGPTGRVLGIDQSELFLAEAKGDAEQTQLTNIELVHGDAQTHSFEPEFDWVFSRFGIMFFADPRVAMSNLRSALRPGGRGHFVVWRHDADNLWARLPRELVQKYLPEAEDSLARAGGFSMADPIALRQLLESAGFASIELERYDAKVPMGRDLDECVRMLLDLGPAGRMLRAAGEQAVVHRPSIEAELRDTLASFVVDGRVVLPSSTWQVSVHRDR